MSPHATAWIEPPVRRKPIPMTVKVRTPYGERQYPGCFASSFDAYDDALERFGELALRIEVVPATQGSKS